MTLQTALIILAIAAFIGFLISIPALQKMLRIWRTPAKWINALPDQGLVRVTGEVAGNTTASPLKKTPCAFWQLEVKEEQKNKNSSTWHTILKVTSSQPILLNDETGEVQILPEGADLILNDDAILDDLKLDQKMFLQETYALDIKNSEGEFSILQAVERLIIAGDPIFVLGNVHVVEGEKTVSAGYYGENAGLVISEQGDEQLLNTLKWRVIKNIVGLVCIAGAVIVIAFLSFFQTTR